MVLRFANTEVHFSISAVGIVLQWRERRNRKIRKARAVLTAGLEARLGRRHLDRGCFLRAGRRREPQGELLQVKIVLAAATCAFVSPVADEEHPDIESWT
jgi:hypothetical protein